MNTTIASPITGLLDLRGREIKVLMVCEPPAKNPVLHFSDPAMGLAFWRKHVEKASWYDPEKEVCVVMCLDRKSHVKAWNLVSIGTATSSLVGTREVLRPVISCAATAFVLLHNHPSGDPAPSEADEVVTDNLCAAVEYVGVDFVDHIIIGRPERDPRGLGYYSFQVGRRSYARKQTPAVNQSGKPATTTNRHHP